MGRNMFGPIRGGLPDDAWRGRRGEDPPFHHPVFVLTHRPRASIMMQVAPRSTSSPAAFTSSSSRPVEAAGGRDAGYGCAGYGCAGVPGGGI